MQNMVACYVVAVLLFTGAVLLSGARLLG
jgi:hypothetical protein